MAPPPSSLPATRFGTLERVFIVCDDAFGRNGDAKGNVETKEAS